MSKTARLMKDSGIEWIGEIPVGWETIRFKKVHNTANVGSAIDKEYWSDNPDDRYFYTAQVEPIHTSFQDFPSQKYTNSNDLLLARNGTPYVYFPYEDSIYSDHIIRVDLKSGFDRKFIQHALQTSIKTETVTGVSILTWSVSIWDRQVLPLPPLPEQQKIADYLDEKCGKIDLVIAKSEEIIEKLKAYKLSLITETVTKGLDPNAPMKDSGIEWIGEIPREWETIRFKKVHNTANVGSAIDKEYWSDNPDDRYFYTAQVEPIHTSFQDFPSQKYTNSNDLLLARNGTPYVYFPYEDSIYSDHIIRVDLKSGFDRKFIQHALQTSIKTETVTGVSILTWSVSIWDRQVLPLPPLPEQQKIAAYLDAKCAAIDKNIADRQTLIEKLTAYKKSLIYEAVTGKKEI